MSRRLPTANCRPTLLLSLALTLTAGCGYRFTAGPVTLPQGIRAVSAPVFGNQTAEPGLQAVFTQSLREQLTRAGIEARADADAELSGEVLSVWGGPALLTTPKELEPATLASYRIFATAQLRLRKSGQILSERVVSGSEDYLPGVDVLQTEANRDAALRRLADRLMREGFERIAAED
ncbi:MAG: LptE family protein [Myxococcaceae bacterium]